MTTIAHLTDLHLLEEDHEARSGMARARLSYLTFGRPTNARRRRLRAARALERARAADHVVLTGDLTEDGLDRQLEILGEVLRESRIPASRVTIVPGNHDAYTDPNAFSRALSGPLAPFAKTSGGGAVVSLPGATLLALSTAVAQAFTRSAGGLGSSQLDILRSLARETRWRGQPLIVAMHHPPEPKLLAPIEWIDGLKESAELMEILEANDHVTILHGHTHAKSDRAVRRGGTPRLFCAASVVGSDAPVRTYLARHGRVWPEIDDDASTFEEALAF